MTMIIKYTIEDYKKILDNIVFQEFDKELQEKINNLRQSIILDEKDKDKNNYYRNKKNYNNLQLQNIRSFQKTKILINKLDYDIKNILNKITNNNYEIQKKELFNIIQNINNDENYENNFTIIYNKIIDIIKNNIYFSDVYSRLCKELIEINSYFYDKIIDDGKKLAEYLLFIDHENYNDKNNNEYNILCNYNKNKDQKKSILLFFINLFKNDEKNFYILTNILNNILELFEKNIMIENEREKNEDLSELILILFTNINYFDNKYKQQIKNIANYKKKKYPGLSNKIIFKLMDIIDLIEI